LPTVEDAYHAWQEILAEEKSDVVKEISLLSSNQKTVLIFLAKGETAFITSKQVMLDLEMTSSSILVVLQALEVKGIIEKTERGYRIINPVLKHYVLK
jgi:predicted transcriptional regulator